MHFGKKDKAKGFSDPETAQKLEQALKDAGATYELYFYDADHAFANEQRPEVYHKESADLARKRTVEFFKKYLN